MKKLKIFLLVIFCIMFLAQDCVYAGFADYTDEDAEKETQELIRQHEEEFDSTKSDNNYLKDLQITGGALSPNFDRQTLEYELKVEDKTNQINIIAIPEDPSAKVNGAGTVDILNVSECRIDVIAPSGTTRTYLIKTKKQNEETTEENTENQNDENDDYNIIKETNTNIIEANGENSNSKKNSTMKFLIIAGGAIIISIIIFLIIKNLNKKTRH